MSRRLLALSAAAAAVLTLAACGSDSAEADDTAEAAAADGAGACAAHEPLRFSDTEVEGLETLVLEFEDFRVALQEVTGLDVKFQPMSSRAPLPPPWSTTTSMCCSPAQPNTWCSR